MNRYYKIGAKTKKFEKIKNYNYLPNIRKCIFVGGLNDPVSSKTIFLLVKAIVEH